MVNINNNINNNNNNLNNVAVNTNNANNADANVNNAGANIVIAMPGRRRRSVPIPRNLQVFRFSSLDKRWNKENLRVNQNYTIMACRSRELNPLINIRHDNLHCRR